MQFFGSSRFIPTNILSTGKFVFPSWAKDKQCTSQHMMNYKQKIMMELYPAFISKISTLAPTKLHSLSLPLPYVTIHIESTVLLFI